MDDVANVSQYDREFLAALYKDLTIAWRCIGALGISASRTGENFLCPIHPEAHPSADQALFFELQRQRNILLLTTTRKGKDKSPKRKRMIKVLQQQKNKRLYKQRSYTVEPMPGLVKDIFELERCWMHGNTNKRWLFATMGVVVQMHQYRAWTEGRSTWAIKQEVLGR